MCLRFVFLLITRVTAWLRLSRCEDAWKIADILILRGQIRIDIPIIVTKVSYVGAAFPTLKPQGNYLPSLTMTANGTSQATSLVASMDSVIGLDFKNEMPIVITKTIAATVTKAVAAYGVNEAASQKGDFAALVSQITTAGY